LPRVFASALSARPQELAAEPESQLSDGRLAPPTSKRGQNSKNEENEEQHLRAFPRQIRHADKAKKRGYQGNYEEQYR
jgi:hypothetical protein